MLCLLFFTNINHLRSCRHTTEVSVSCSGASLCFGAQGYAHVLLSVDRIKYITSLEGKIFMYDVAWLTRALSGVNLWWMEVCFGQGLVKRQINLLHVWRTLPGKLQTSFCPCPCFISIPPKMCPYPNVFCLISPFRLSAETATWKYIHVTWENALKSAFILSCRGVCDKELHPLWIKRKMTIVMEINFRGTLIFYLIPSASFLSLLHRDENEIRKAQGEVNIIIPSCTHQKAF